MCLQYTDFSRTVIGFFVPALSDGSLKREVSLSLRDIHSVQLLSALRCYRPTEWEAPDRQMDSSGQVETEWGTLKSCWSLSDTQAGESNQHSNQFLLSPRTSLLSQQILSAADTEMLKELRTSWERLPKIYSLYQQILLCRKISLQLATGTHVLQIYN